MAVLVGGEKFDEELLESVRCPSCGERIDLTGEDVDRKTSFALDHVQDCLGGEGSTSISRDGWEVGERLFGVDDLRPLSRPRSPEATPSPEELAERLKEKDWDGGLYDGVVMVDGFTEEKKYTIDPGTGRVYGEGPLKGRLEDFVEEYGNYYRSLKREGKLEEE